MKRILLLRHAKAVAKSAHDFERVLAPEGHREMERVARHLADTGLRPDLALVSPAARTRETWDRTRLAGVPVRFEDGIYHGTEDTLLDLIRAADPAADTLILVGHNPTIETAALSLSRNGDGADRRELGRGMATAGLATVEQDVAEWADVAFGTGRLVAYVTPASLGSS